MSEENQALSKEMESLKINEWEQMTKLITLFSSDGKEFVVESRVAFQSEMIQNAIEDCEYDKITLPNVDALTLHKILEYCREHSDEKDNLDEFDEKFVDVHPSFLYDLLMAANYLCIKNLVKMLCKRVARLIKGKSVEEIRAYFEIENDFEPGQEDEIRSENRWAFKA